MQRLTLVLLLFLAAIVHAQSSKKNSIRFFAGPGMSPFSDENKDDNRKRETGPNINDFAPLESGETRAFRVTLFESDDWNGKFAYGTEFHFKPGNFFELGCTFRNMSLRNADHARKLKWTSFGLQPRVNFSSGEKRIVPYMAVDLNIMLFSFQQDQKSMKATDNTTLSYESFDAKWRRPGLTTALGLDANLSESMGLFLQVAFTGSPSFIKDGSQLQEDFNSTYRFPGYFEPEPGTEISGIGSLQLNFGVILHFDLIRQKEF